MIRIHLPAMAPGSRSIFHPWIHDPDPFSIHESRIRIYFHLWIQDPNPFSIHESRIRIYIYPWIQDPDPRENGIDPFYWLHKHRNYQAFKNNLSSFFEAFYYFFWKNLSFLWFFWSVEIFFNYFILFFWKIQGVTKRQIILLWILTLTHTTKVPVFGHYCMKPFILIYPSCLVRRRHISKQVFCVIIYKINIHTSGMKLKLLDHMDPCTLENLKSYIKSKVIFCNFIDRFFLSG